MGFIKKPVVEYSRISCQVKYELTEKDWRSHKQRNRKSETLVVSLFIHFISNWSQFKVGFADDKSFIDLININMFWKVSVSVNFKIYRVKSKIWIEFCTIKYFTVNISMVSEIESNFNEQRVISGRGWIQFLKRIFWSVNIFKKYRWFDKFFLSINFLTYISFCLHFPLSSRHKYLKLFIPNLWFHFFILSIIF
jgi:hypothetical protein